MSSEQKKLVRPDDVCIITPTKGRHRQLTNLLRTLSQQTLRVGRIIIADGGRDAEAVVAPFADRLPVRWLDCPQPGQVIQRNLALKELPPGVEVVIYLDDDIQLQADAIENLLRFWNAQEIAPAGISLNITNNPEQPDNVFRHLFFMGSEPFGKVLRSGYNTPVTRLRENIESQWLIGGATAWRKDIVLATANQPIASRWAITEDLMFSYGLWKSGERLLACADARVQHIDDTPTETFQVGLFRGNNATIWRYFFVAQHPELSKAQFFWMMTGQTLSRLGGALRGNPRQFGYFLGNLQGMVSCARSMMFGTDIKQFLR
jgi:GT2 family glycosyltransferase